MSSLRELQIEFVHHIVDQENTKFIQEIIPNRLTPQQRLGVYRNNFYSNLVSALRSTYPVVERLVGEEFFRHAARAFARAHASTSGDLNQYGEQFTDFLSEFHGTSDLVYLPDTAKLEWCYQQVYYAQDITPLSLQRLADIPEKSRETLCFSLNPAARLLASDYPVHRVWKVNQPGYLDDQMVNVTQGGVKLLIIRRESGVEMQPLQEGDYRFLAACVTGTEIADACECALSADPGFDLNRALMQFVRENVLVDFSVNLNE